MLCLLIYENMGGIGSTRWAEHKKATTVGECLVINISTLNSSGWLDYNGQVKSGVISWNNAIVEELASIGIVSRLSDSGGHLVLQYTVNQFAREPRNVTCTVRLQTTRPYFGGLRWWFTCPICERRVAKLYQPPNDNRFLCRHCHKLSYKSSQESDQRVNNLRKLGLQEIIKWMRDGSPSDIILGLKALRGWL